MKQARAAGDRAAAQIVAAACVVLAETKDHTNWELIGKCAEHADGAAAEALKRAYDEIEDQEDEHLYHTKGWCRELWIESLGIAAVLPPPEERRQVKTAIGAARAEQSAEKARVPDSVVAPGDRSGSIVPKDGRRRRQTGSNGSRRRSA